MERGGMGREGRVCGDGGVRREGGEGEERRE
jgi:hypothetical protein